MANVTRNFVAGKMNKVVDQRLVPDGEYIDAMNIRMGSTEKSEIGVIENAKGNIALTAISYQGSLLSINALCIGAYQDSANETLYWFVHDPAFDSNISSVTGKLDLIMSFNTLTGILTYHVISVWDGVAGSLNTVLNFNPNYVITAVDKIGDLLFFSDDYNPPRFINVKRNYPNPVFTSGNFVDGGIAPSSADLLKESLLVIKRPPINAPLITASRTSGQENYLESRFICFAYRYKYADGEYSATSQWSEPLFVTREFSFNIENMLNEGMLNQFNQAIITYNTGGHLVVGIDLLFKSADNSTIKVIDKIDKVAAGLGDNTDVNYAFSNSKIYTVLPSSEILRLYDNVPKLAKAQTIMGNRLMYGNYVEGYDIVDKFGVPTKIAYTTDLISSEINFGNLSSSTSSGTYGLSSPYATFTPTLGPMANSKFSVDLSGMPLTFGTTLSIDFTINHSAFQYQSTVVSAPSQITPPTNYNFSFYLPRNYTSVNDLTSSQEFIDAIGSIGGPSGIQPVQTSASGLSFTDTFNAGIPNSLNWASSPTGDCTKFYSAISGSIPQPSSTLPSALAGFPILITNPSGSNVVTFQLLAMVFADYIANGVPTTSLYAIEYFKVTSIKATYIESGSARSLHSNRGYEIGMVYMDDFNRSTTVLVSKYNTQHVPCGYSINKNEIQVTIPVTQRAPVWAKRFKFVCRADRDTYETIYSNYYYLDTTKNVVWVLLEGENARKVENGNQLIVKADASGPTNDCVYTTVLDKEVFASQVSSLGGNNPAGVYIKLKPINFDAVMPAGSFKDLGTGNNVANGGAAPLTSLLLSEETSPGVWIPISINAGSRILLEFKSERSGSKTGNSCERRNYTFSKVFVASANYPDFKAWWDGDNIPSVLNTGTWDVGSGGSNGTNIYDPTMDTGTYPPSGWAPDFDLHYKFFTDTTTSKLYLVVQGMLSCTSIISNTSGRRSHITAHITIRQDAGAMIFETMPIDTAPDLFYENNLSFPIDSDGNHLANGNPNDQSQDIATNTPGIFKTGFFNCFTFGNGAESYRIEDSATGHYFQLGNRVTAVSAQDYREIDRYADITYSGVYNQETNVNKLNEFNLGLVNFKKLEYSFGEVFILEGRETDVRVLQEDKISYVLAGKNLLSDSIGGGAVTSVPEVLGTQIARIEGYGISFNPESYAKWGRDTFFTDVKRGAVIQLKGDSYSNEQLGVVSEFGMRTWFRDTFIDSFNTQKLGAFDPYMNEYVLSSNERELPLSPQCVPCGSTQTLSFNNDSGDYKYFTYCVDVGSLVGNVNIDYIVTNSHNSEIVVDYGANSYSSGVLSGAVSGSFNFYKDDILNETATITLAYDYDVDIQITVNCPNPEPLRIIEVVYTSDSQAGQTIHVEYMWNSGAYTSALISRGVTFLNGTINPFASWYNDISGYAGAGGFPPEGSGMRLYTNQISPDTFVFNASIDQFRFLRTNTLYGNNPTDLANLYTASTLATPVVTGATINYADFTVPTSASGNILYLIWDLRDRQKLLLCYSDGGGVGVTPEEQACCGCPPCTRACVLYRFQNIGTTDAIVVFPSGLCENAYTEAELQLNPGEYVDLCIVNENDWFVLSGDIRSTVVDCICSSSCVDDCVTYTLINNTESDSNGIAKNCVTGIDTSINNVPAGFNVSVCSKVDIRNSGSGIWAPSDLCGCCESSTCCTYEVVVSGLVNISYIDCNGDTQTFTGYNSIHYYLCVQKTQQLIYNAVTSAYELRWGSWQPTVYPLFTGSSASSSIFNPCSCNQ